MASDSNSENGGSEDRREESHAPRECMPCRGSGQVISNLGGAPSKITCPWCGGGGVRVPEIDAQAKWPANDAPAPQEAAVPEK
jgi:DnaJ-class molecular chaperone